VVDMTGTVFCDSLGLNTLIRAHQRALAEGGGLRLVTADGPVLRIFTLTRLDQFIPCFASLEEALAQMPAAANAQARRPATRQGRSPGGRR
jgi:anti-anti-sigma regulatory factor